MRRLGLVLVALLVVGAFGCDGDDDAATPPPVVPPPTTPTPPTTVTLDQGTPSVPSGGPMTAASFSVAQSGTLTGTVTWGAPAVTGLSGFVHVATATLHGAGTGASPLTSTATVTDALVTSGQNWDFYIAHDDVAPVNMTYVVTFTPD